MTSVALVLFVVVVTVVVIRGVRRSDGLVARRGLSVGADLASLDDKPRVRIRSATPVGADRVHLELAPVDEADRARVDPADLDLTVYLGAHESGFGIIDGWRRSGARLGIVVPEGSRIVRLRSIEDLQPLTLRRVDD